MADAAEDLFRDESLSADETEVDEVIRRAGGERAAIRVLLVEIAEAQLAQARAAANVSLGYRRGRQPQRRLP